MRKRISRMYRLKKMQSDPQVAKMLAKGYYGILGGCYGVPGGCYCVPSGCYCVPGG